jgi:hypothetical protein
MKSNAILSGWRQSSRCDEAHGRDGTTPGYGRVAGDGTAFGDRVDEGGRTRVLAFERAEEWVACGREASGRRRACGQLRERRCNGLEGVREVGSWNV